MPFASAVRRDSKTESERGLSPARVPPQGVRHVAEVYVCTGLGTPVGGRRPPSQFTRGLM
jgi:hypothetical protein